VQALSELIKRIAFLRRVIWPEPISVEAGKSDEEKLAENWLKPNKRLLAATAK
jgi:hypothetical protein